MFSQRLQAVSKSMTRKKNQEQLALPEIEPAFSLEIQALPEAASTSQAVPAPAQRTRSKRPPSNKEKATANHRPARKHRKNLLEVDADTGDAEGQAITEVTPARSYHRPTAPGPGQIQLRAEGRLLHIHLLSEPEWNGAVPSACVPATPLMAIWLTCRFPILLGICQPTRLVTRPCGRVSMRCKTNCSS